MNSISGRRRRHFALGLAAAACLGMGSALAQAQAWPVRTVTLVTGAPPGGGTDATTRALAEALASRLSHPVVVDNRPGAGGSIAGAQVARAPADGHTLLLVASGHALQPAIIKNLPYDPARDFAGVVRIADVATLLVAGAHTGVRSFKDLRELADRDPRALTFGASDPSLRLDSETVGAALGAPVNVVNYKGTTLSLTDIAGGHLGFAITSMAAVQPFLAGGKVVPIAAVGARRSSLMPELPTFAELGVKGFDTGPWYALLAPAGTPKALVAEINRQANEALKDPKLLERMKGLGIQPAGGSPSALDVFIRSEVKRLGEAAAKAGIVPQ